MSRLEISTEGGRLAFHPGEELRGTASWSLDAPPTKVELRLFWRTEGKGSQDVGVVETLSFDGAGAEDRREFRLRLPPGPYSFSGKLISLIWALELVAERVLAVRYRFLEGGWEDLFARLRGLEGRGAIVGPEGSGKTTLLEDLAKELQRRGRSVSFVALSPGERRLSSRQRGAVLEVARSESFLLVDGADALTPRAWRALHRQGRRASGFVVTAHAEGLLPTLWRTWTSARRQPAGGSARALRGLCGRPSVEGTARRQFEFG